MNSKELTYLVLSDIHLGHKRNRTEDIVHNLREYIKDYYKQIIKAKIIFIAGDVFDRLLSTNSTEYLLATEWLTELILFCRKHNIKLRILEGTPSHDWRQAKIISSIIEKLKIEIDYKYISTLYIEHMVDEDIHIMYMPDEYKANAEEAYQDVLALLKEKGLSKVDIAIMHGQFHHQLPGIVLESSHTEDNYLNIVKYFINIGHIHTPSVYQGRILASGSFDRLAQNEEEDKGGLLCTIYKDGSFKFVFLKNTRAKIFKTLDYTNSNISIEEITREIYSILDKLEPDSFVRILINDPKCIEGIKDKYPLLHIKILSKEDKKLKIGDDILQEEVIESFTITKDNIEELMMKELVGLSPSDIIIAKEELTNASNI